MSFTNCNVKTNYGKARTGGFDLIMPWLIRIVSMLLPHNFHKKKASLTDKFSTAFVPSSFNDSEKYFLEIVFYRDI